MSAAALKDNFSLRQRQVLIGVARGKTSAEIAEDLGIGKRTVEDVRAAVLRKIGKRSQAALVLEAVRLGYVQPGDAP